MDEEIIVHMTWMSNDEPVCEWPFIDDFVISQAGVFMGTRPCNRCLDVMTWRNKADLERDLGG